MNSLESVSSFSGGITYTGSHHLQLRRAILRIIRQLVLPNPAEVPKHDPPIVATATQNRRLLGVPRQRCYRIVVAHQRVDLFLDIPDIPDGHCLVRRRCGYYELGTRIEGQRIDSIRVSILCRQCRPIQVGLPKIKDLERQVVRNGAEEVLNKRVVLDVVDYVCVVLVLSVWLQTSTLGLEKLKIP